MEILSGVEQYIFSTLQSVAGYTMGAPAKEPPAGHVSGTGMAIGCRLYGKKYKNEISAATTLPFRFS